MSKVFHLSSKAKVNVSHKAKIKKQALFSSGEIPHITQYAIACFKPGQEVETHKHQDMFEVFFVVEGGGELIIDGESYQLRKGITFLIEPGEEHKIINNSKEDLVLQYFGVV